MQNKLLEILRERDISQSELANLTNISRNTIGAICRNATDSIRFEVLESILNVLRITPNEFFSVAESTNKPTKVFVKEYSDAYTLSSVDSLNRDIETIQGRHRIISHQVEKGSAYILVEWECDFNEK